MKKSIKKLSGIGQYYLESVPYANGRWYYAIDSNHGDVYEAQEIFEQGHELKGDVLTLVSYPEGEIRYQSGRRKNVSYVSPVFNDGCVFFAAVDFNEKEISICRFDTGEGKINIVEELSLDKLETCYNLNLFGEPLTLSVQYCRDGEMFFHIVYPEDVTIKGELRESFYHREGDRLYSCRWHEDEDLNYYEDTVVRSVKSGEIIEEIEGDITVMPDGQMWLIK